MFETLRRLCDDAYRAQDSGMSVGLPRVNVDASQLKHLLDHYDAQQTQLAEAQDLLRVAYEPYECNMAFHEWHQRRDALLSEE